jgi:hypothetical protein
VHRAVAGVLPLWTGESHPCGDASNNNRPWPGVTCDAPNGYVTAIQLSRKGLRGPLPDSLSVLRTLRTLDLSNNSFEGALPNSWSNLTSLEICDLSDNRLTGSLPPTYSSWSALQSLDLHRNRLTGPLPATWASMNSLTVRAVMLRQLVNKLLTRAGWLGHSSCSGQGHCAAKPMACQTVHALAADKLSPQTLQITHA